MRINSFLKQNYLIISIFLIGVAIRLIYGFLFNHMVDFMNILALTRSVTETGSLAGGFSAINKLGHEVQLYGKIYYQIAGLWLILLDKLKLLSINYIFDTHSYQNPYSYLTGLGQWSPPLFQLMAIKLMQFFWDFLLLFFLYKLTKEFRIQKIHYVVLFWAFNPFFMMISYAIFMSDMAMVTLFVGGTWLWVRSLNQNTNKFLCPSVIGTILLFDLGAVIKLVPLLLIPFLLISRSKNILSFVIYSVIAILGYILFNQPWASDAVLMKHFYLLSKESTSLFRYTINNVPLFLLLYLSLLTLVFLQRKRLFTSSINIILLIIGTICMVYISDTLFFIQFLIWIIPFAAIFSLVVPQHSWVLLFSFVAIFIKTIASSDYFSTLLSPTIGSGFSGYLQNSVLISKFFKYDLYNSLLHTIIIVIFIMIGIFSFSSLFNLNKKFGDTLAKEIKLSFTKIVLFTFAAYVLSIGTDYMIKSRYILLPQYKYQISNNEVAITKKPLKLTIQNPEKRVIQALEIPIIRKGFTYDSNTIFKFTKDGKIINMQRVNDFEFPTQSDELFRVFLSKPLNEKEFDLEIYKEGDLNEVVSYESKILGELNSPPSGLYKGYDLPSTQEIISLKFYGKIIPIYLRGKYGFLEIFKGVNFNLKTKPHFYLAYFLTILLLIIITGFIYLKYSSRKIINE